MESKRKKSNLINLERINSICNEVDMANLKYRGDKKEKSDEEIVSELTKSLGYESKIFI